MHAIIVGPDVVSEKRRLSFIACSDHDTRFTYDAVAGVVGQVIRVAGARALVVDAEPFDGDPATRLCSAMRLTVESSPPWPALEDGAEGLSLRPRGAA